MSIFSRLFGSKKGDSAERAEEFINTMKAELNLSSDQVTRIQSALQEFFGERKAMRQSGAGKSGLRESKQDFKEDIINALNPMQQKKFMENIQMYKQLLNR